MILFRYFLREIIQATLAVSFVLLLIVMSGRLAKYLAQASSGDLAVDVVFLVVLYRIPDFLPLVLPLGFFIGILLAYGRLYVESEMVVTQACGIGKRYLLLVTLLPAALVAAIVAYLSLLGAPESLSKVQAILKDPSNRQGIAILQQGKFQASRDGDTITYAERLSADRENIFGVLMVERGSQGRLSVIRAERGEIEGEEGEKKYFTLSNGVAYEGTPGASNYQVTRFVTYGQRLELASESDKRRLKVDAKSTRELRESSNPEHIAALHWRYSLPAVVPVVALLALGLSPTNHRAGRFAKMLPAILIYLAYIVVITAMRDMLAQQDIPIAGFWSAHVAFLVVGFALLFRDEIMLSLRARKPVGRST